LGNSYIILDKIFFVIEEREWYLKHPIPIKFIT